MPESIQKQAMKYTLHNVIFPNKAKELENANAAVLKNGKTIKKLKEEKEELTKEYNEQLTRLVYYEKQLVDFQKQVNTLMYTSETYRPKEILQSRNGKYLIQWEPSWESAKSEVVKLNPRLVEAFRQPLTKDQREAREMVFGK